jgi:translation initiation factor 4E
MSEQVDLTTIPISPEGGNVDGGASEEGGKLITVFHDKDNFNVKHPLSNRWTLWFTKPASGKVRSRCPAPAPAPGHKIGRLC